MQTQNNACEQKTNTSNGNKLAHIHHVYKIIVYFEEVEEHTRICVTIVSVVHPHVAHQEYTAG